MGARVISIWCSCDSWPDRLPHRSHVYRLKNHLTDRVLTQAQWNVHACRLKTESHIRSTPGQAVGLTTGTQEGQKHTHTHTHTDVTISASEGTVVRNQLSHGLTSCGSRKCLCLQYILLPSLCMNSESSVLVYLGHLDIWSYQPSVIYMIHTAIYRGELCTSGKEKYFWNNEHFLSLFLKTVQLLFEHIFIFLSY